METRANVKGESISRETGPKKSKGAGKRRAEEERKNTVKDDVCITDVEEGKNPACDEVRECGDEGSKKGQR